MAKELYLETNFAIGIAKGQDPEAEGFLANPPESIRLLIPSVCYMEAFSNFNREKSDKNQLGTTLNAKLAQVIRDPKSSIAVDFAHALRSSRLNLDEHFELFSTRLYATLDALSKKGHLIALNSEIVDRSLRDVLIPSPTDNLILSCILWHAENHPADLRAFVSGNPKDFNQAPVVEALTRAGVKYFAKIEKARDWLLAQNAP